MLIGKVVKFCVFGSVAAVLTSGPAAFAGEASNLQGQRITVAFFGGALQKPIEEAWAIPFEKATGAKVSLDSPNPRAKLKAQVESGNTVWDVYTEDASFVHQNCGVLFDKVDTSQFVAAGIDKRFITNDCGVPTVVVAEVFAYNEDKYRNAPPKSWADFFDLKKFPGKRAIFNSPMTGILEMALLADGVPADKLYPLDLDRAFKKLDTIKDKIFWTQSPGALTDALANSQVDLALAFSGRVAAAAKAGAKVAVVRNQQFLSWDDWAIVKGSKNKAAGIAFLNFASQPKQQAKFTELASYATANSDGHPKVDSLSARFLPVRENAVFINQGWWAKNFDAVNQRFVAWQSQ
ncbi:TPA: extracellular solute-binding protein [Burkholderia cenocepacia]|nr:extracellular solute-binding protein [Burkholderia cenocepacia]